MQIRLDDMTHEELKKACDVIIRLWVRTGIEEPTTRRVFGRVAEALADEMERKIFKELIP